MQARIDQVEHEIKDIQQKKEDEENEIEGTGSGSNGEEDDDKYDQTYEEKVRNQLIADGYIIIPGTPQHVSGSPRRHCGPHQPHLFL